MLEPGMGSGKVYPDKGGVPMTIDKDRVDRSLRKVRGLYRNHAEGELSPSGFVTKARAELHSLYIQHTKELVEKTASRLAEELRAYQAQFGLDVNFGEVHLIWKSRGYRGIRASMYISNKVYNFFSGSTEVFIGPFDEWDNVAVHTPKERESWNEPSLYTKRKRNRWQTGAGLRLPRLLQRIKEEVEKPAPEYEEEIPF
jgi:hypothetical protein